MCPTPDAPAANGHSNGVNGQANGDNGSCTCNAVIGTPAFS